MSFTYRGTSSDSMFFNVTERQVYNAPAFDVNAIEVPGRSGDVLNSQNRYKNKTITYTGFLRSQDFPGSSKWEKLSRGLRNIKAWICGDAGKYHDLTDDYDPGYVRRAFVSGETAINILFDRPDGATITITFLAEPFMYEVSEPIEVPESDTASGSIATFDGVDAPLKSLSFSIAPSQSGSGDPSPSNIRPISGWTQVDGKQSGVDMTDYTPITIALGQTVYGAREDALRGKMVIDQVKVTLNGTQPISLANWRPTAKGVGWLYSQSALGNKVYTSDQAVQKIVSNKLKTVNYATAFGATQDNIVSSVAQANGISSYGLAVRISDTSLTTTAAINAYLAANPIDVVYELATPIEVDLTPVSVSSLLGQNNIWCNTGDTEVEYIVPTENPTQWPSKPRLEITMSGAGTLTVNGKTWSIGAYTGTLICDSEIMDWYDAGALKNSLVSGDGFPEFQPGENVITYTGGITKVVATPRWRTL